MVDHEAWSKLREMSRDFLQPWEGTWKKDALNRDSFYNLLYGRWLKYFYQAAYTWQIFLRGADGKPGELVGGISIENIYRGHEQKATLSYWIGQHYAHQGYMSEAARLVCDFGFETLKLRSLEASCSPENEASKRLLQRLGFAEVGATDRQYINGKWRDMILWNKMRT